MTRRPHWTSSGVLALVTGVLLVACNRSGATGYDRGVTQDIPRQNAASAQRVLLEIIPSGPTAARLEPIDRAWLSQLEPVLSLRDTELCGGPPIPGRSKPPVILTAVLRGNKTFDDLKTAVAGICHSSPPAADRGCRIAGIFVNPALRPIDGSSASGDPDSSQAIEVAERWQDAGLWRDYGTGKGVWLAVVDQGFSTAALSMLFSNMEIVLDPERGYVVPGTALPANPGQASPSVHGTMVAYDALLAAYEATLLDIRIPLDSDDSSVAGAACGFGYLAGLLEKNADPDQPMVVVNSWAVRQAETPTPPVTAGPPCAANDPRLTDAAVSNNPCHPYHRALARLVDAGADVVFAAGNDSSALGANGMCQPVPGTIFGINSSPRVLTVSAANLSGDPLLNSSVGPGQLFDHKPDLAAYSGFVGSGVYPTDSGTSAAAAVAAGVLAALRTKRPKLTPADLKARLIEAAARTTNDWDCRVGAGLLRVPQRPLPRSIPGRRRESPPT